MGKQGSVWENELMPFGDKSMTKGEFYEENRGLVYRVAGKHCHGCEEKFAEGIQNGFLGFMKAVESFDEKQGYTFATYAWMKISRTIQRERELASYDFPFVIPIHTRGTEIERQKFKKKYGGSTSLDYHPKKQDGEAIVDFADLGNFVTEEDICQRIDFQLLNKAIENLDQRKKGIIKMKLQESTLLEISKIFSISKERVRQLICESHRELKKALAPIMPDRVARGNQL